MNTKKTRKIGCDWFKVTLEVRKVRKIAGVAVSLKSALGPRGTRYFLQNFRGRAGGVAGRSRANNAKVNGNPNHARSLVFFVFSWSPGQEARPFMRPRSGQMCPASDHASVGPPRRALTKV